jgi:hypothetical protein
MHSPYANFLLLAVLISACAPLSLKAKFSETGEMGTSGSPPLSDVGEAGQVKVFYASAPDGFSLKDNELKVEPGFRHHILGTVEVKYNAGACDDVRDLGRPRDYIAELMKRRAHLAGANAVIYAVIDVSGDDDGKELSKLCTSRELNRSLFELSFARGWAVVLRP